MYKMMCNICNMASLFDYFSQLQIQSILYVIQMHIMKTKCYVQIHFKWLNCRSITCDPGYNLSDILTALFVLLNREIALG